MLKLLEKQLETETPIVNEFLDIKPLPIQVISDELLIDSKLNELLSNDTVKIDFFKKNVLTAESRLIVTRIESRELLAIAVLNKDINLEMILPIKQIDIFIREDTVLSFGDDYETSEQITRIEYESILFGSDGQYFRSVDPLNHSCEFLSVGKNDITKIGGKIKEKPFTSLVNRFQGDNTALKFIVSLPINSDSVISQLHEDGHYFDLFIACNKVSLSAISQLLNHNPDSDVVTIEILEDLKPLVLTPEILEDLKSLKTAEVRAWLYANHFLKLIGSNANLFKLDRCKDALKSYDMILGEEVLNSDTIEDKSTYFIFPETIATIRQEN